MAKRKKTRKSYSKGRKRSRVSGMGAIDIMNIVAVAGGAVVAGMVNKFIPGTVNDKIVSGGKIALGVVLPMLSKDGKTKNLLSGVGAGMIAVGSVELLKSFGVLSGLGADDETISVSLDGIGESVLAESVLAEDVLSMNDDDLSVVNGIGEDDDLSVVNGIGEDDLSVVNGDDEDFFM
jgi:hypothetical protein